MHKNLQEPCFVFKAMLAPIILVRLVIVLAPPSARAGARVDTHSVMVAVGDPLALLGLRWGGDRVRSPGGSSHVGGQSVLEGQHVFWPIRIVPVSQVRVGADAGHSDVGLVLGVSAQQSVVLG